MTSLDRRDVTAQAVTMTQILMIVAIALVLTGCGRKSPLDVPQPPPEQTQVN